MSSKNPIKLQHPGFRELELYVEGGLTPLEALRTATTIPAKVMNLDARLGVVDRGKDADIIFVSFPSLAKRTRKKLV